MGLAGLGLLGCAAQPQPAVVQTVEVEKVVEKEVIKTILVDRPVTIEKEIITTVEVEKFTTVEVEKYIEKVIERTVPVQDFSGEHLVLQTWSGSYADSMKKCVYEPFEEIYGAEIITSIPGTEWMSLAQIKQEAESGRPKVDLSTCLPTWVIRGIRDNFWDPIDTNNVPNLKNLYPEANDFMPWGVGYLVYTYGIIYNTGTFDSPPDSWSVLWDPKYKSRVGMIKQAADYLFPIMNYIATGKVAPYDYDATFAILDKIKANVLAWPDSVGGLETLFVNDEIDLSTIFDGRTSNMVQKGVPVEYAMPKEGVMGAFDYYSIVRNTPKKKLAEAFINFALDPDVQDCVSHSIFYGPTNTTVNLDKAAADRQVSNEAEFGNLIWEDYEYAMTAQDELYERWQQWLIE